MIPNHPSAQAENHEKEILTKLVCRSSIVFATGLVLTPLGHVLRRQGNVDVKTFEMGIAIAIAENIGVNISLLLIAGCYLSYTKRSKHRVLEESSIPLIGKEEPKKKPKPEPETFNIIPHQTKIEILLCATTYITCGLLIPGIKEIFFDQLMGLALFSPIGVSVCILPYKCTFFKCKKDKKEKQPPAPASSTSATNHPYEHYLNIPQQI